MVPRDIPAPYEGLYQQAMSGRSRRAAVRSFCLECVGYVSAEVTACTDKGCPLYPYRIISTYTADSCADYQGASEQGGTIGDEDEPQDTQDEIEPS